MLSKKVEIFLYVAQQRSFSKAAEMLFLSTPAVTKQIGALEQEVGAPLFFRTNKGVRLTAAGEVLYADAEKMVEMRDTALHRARISAGILEKTVIIGTVCSDSNRIIPNVCRVFKQQFPDIEVKFLKTAHSSMADDLRTRAIDLCFVHGKKRSNWDGITYHAIIQDSIACLVPVGHRLEGYDRIVLADLRGEQMLFGEEEGDSEYHNKLRKYIIDHEPDIQLHNVIRDLTLAGLIQNMSVHINVCPRLCMPEESAMKIKPFEDDPAIEIGMLCRTESNPIVKEFLGIAKRTLCDILSNWMYD